MITRELHLEILALKKILKMLEILASEKWKCEKGKVWYLYIEAGEEEIEKFNKSQTIQYTYL